MDIESILENDNICKKVSVFQVFQAISLINKYKKKGLHDTSENLMKFEEVSPIKTNANDVM